MRRAEGQGGRAIGLKEGGEQLARHGVAVFGFPHGDQPVARGRKVGLAFRVAEGIASARVLRRDGEGQAFGGVQPGGGHMKNTAGGRLRALHYFRTAQD